MKFQGMGAALLAAWIGLAASAVAEDTIPIDAFYGVWSGNAVSESSVSVNFQLTARDIGIEVQPSDNKGFLLRWYTVQRQKGDPANPTPVLKETSVEFVPVNGPHQWVAKDFTDPRNRDGSMVWARMEGQTLIVNSFALGEDGVPEHQVYRRTLDPGTGMKLDYTRFVDGRRVRTARGSLVLDNR